MRFLEAVANLFYPPRCCACARATHAPGFCTDCARRIERPQSPQCPRCGVPFATRTDAPLAGPRVGPPASADHECGRCLRRRPRYRRARACAMYAAANDDVHPLQSVLHRYKYRRDVNLAPPLARLLTERAPLQIAAYDVIVPVPLHLDRLRWRGFNQAQLLAIPLARTHGVALNPFALERVRPTLPQVELSGPDRRRNVAHAFRVTQPGAVRGRDVLLVDDVYTTGATAEECTRALLRAGARAVDVLVLARAVLR